MDNKTLIIFAFSELIFKCPFYYESLSLYNFSTKHKEFVFHFVALLKSFLSLSELKENVRKLEEWIKDAESVLREPLKFNQKWTRRAINDKMEEIQVSASSI